MHFYICWGRSGVLLGGHFWSGWGHFWSGRGHFLVEFGMSWDVSGSGQGTFSDGFGMVLEKMSGEVGKSKFSKMAGSIFAESGCSRIVFLAYPRPKILKFGKM